MRAKSLRDIVFRSAARIALVAISLTATLGLLEGVVRLAGVERPLLQKHQLIGQRYRPGFSGAAFVPEAGRDVALRFNADGFRGPDRPREKEPGVRRLAVLGDSFIAGLGVDEIETLPEQLALRLAGIETGERWEALNFGVSGSGTTQALLTWRHVARNYQPDLVVLAFFNGNDLSDNHEALSAAHRPIFGLGPDGELRLKEMSPGATRLSRWLADHSRLYVWQKDRWRVLKDRARRAIGIVPPGMMIFRVDPDASGAQAWATTAKLIETLSAEIRATGAEFLVVSIPAHEQLDPAAWAELVAKGAERGWRLARRHPEDRLREICRTAGVAFVSLLETFERRAGAESPFFPERGHWNERGHSLAAEQIARALEPNHLAN